MNLTDPTTYTRNPDLFAAARLLATLAAAGAGFALTPDGAGLIYHGPTGTITPATAALIRDLKPSLRVLVACLPGLGAAGATFATELPACRALRYRLLDAWLASLVTPSPCDLSRLPVLVERAGPGLLRWSYASGRRETVADTV